MAFVDQMLAQLNTGELANSVQLLEKALQFDDPEELFAGAEQLGQAGFSQQAAQIYQHLLDQYPQEDILKVNLAEIKISNDQVDAATDLLAQVSPDSPAYLNALLVGADLYQTLGLYEVSEQKLQQAIHLAPKESVIQFALAELYFNENKFAAALTFYEKLQSQGEKEISGIVISQRLAAVYAGLGQYEEAVQAYQQTPLAFLNADNLYNYASLANKLERNSLTKKVLEQLFQLSPDYAPGYLLAAKLAFKQDQPDKALRFAQTGLSYDPFQVKLYKVGSQAAQKLAEPETAVQLLQMGIKQVSENTALVLSLSSLYLKLGQDQTNLDLLAQFEKQLQDEPQAIWNRGRSELHLDQITAAQTDLLAVYQAYQADPVYLHDLITVLQQGTQDKLPALKAALDKYLKLVPDDYEMDALAQELRGLDED
ncbi:hypothetical protein HU830_00860 [Lactobacillus sp. DCY120]|uniref:TPR repeat-containing protein n=1 Tax=Bombilactobacillus apium TaxID=2675299 RepID=A0A850R085_9LACO|nr:tetratricopeptide repeat protein [Bombilactobacillus apium]NVY95760.1 hypothetical protein [Bombilactobacillus apium]